MAVVVGVLALQGDWQAHGARLAELGAAVREVRTPAQLEGVGGLVLPGGESTAMLRLMEADEMGQRLRDTIGRGLPVLATCAGVILLARRVVPEQGSLGLLDVDVTRNAYGRQVFSSVTELEMAPFLGEPSRTAGVFIRAPRITRAGDDIEVLGRRDGEPVLLRQGPILAATYHPELSDDLRVHQLFVSAAQAHQS